MKNKYIKTLLFAFGYALFVSSLTISFEHHRIFRQLENSVYDPLQKLFAIDDADDWRYERFEEAFGEIYGINLDSSMFDFECDRIRRDRLSKLLTRLSEMKGIGVIFLDYQFEPLEMLNDGHLIGNDSILYERLLAFKDKLVIIDDKNAESKFYKHFDSNNENAKIISGYFQLKNLIGDETIRYLKLDGGIENYDSFVKAMAKILQFEWLLDKISDAPTVMELNYIFRDRRFRGKRPAMFWENASEIIKRDTVSSFFESKGNGIIFIGAFESKLNKYNLAYNNYKTPIHNSLSGIYIKINAFLNLSMNSFVKRFSAYQVFVLNYIIAILGVFYFHQIRKTLKKVFVKPVNWILIEFAILLVMIFSFLVGLFYFFYIKYPFAFTLIALMINQYLYQKYLKMTDKIKLS